MRQQVSPVSQPLNTLWQRNAPVLATLGVGCCLTLIALALTWQADVTTTPAAYGSHLNFNRWIVLIAGFVGTGVASQWTRMILQRMRQSAESTRQAMATSESLKQERDFSRSVIDGLPGFFGMIDGNGRYERWNQNLSDVTGLSHDQLRGLDILSLVPEADRERAQAKILEVFDRGFASAEFQMRVKDGGLRTVQVIGRTIMKDGKRYILMIGTDVTDARAAEQALAYRDRILHAISRVAAELMTESPLAVSMQQALEIAGEALHVDRMLVLNVPSPMSTSSPVSLAFDWQRAGVPRLSPASLSKDPAALKEIEIWLAPLTEGKPVVTYVDTATGVVAKIMREMANLSTLQVPISVKGKYWGHIGVDDVRAIREWTSVEVDALMTLAELIASALRRDQERLTLQQSEERFRAVSETAQDAVIIIDSAGKICFWNAAAERILGYTAQDAIGRTAGDWLPPERFRSVASAGIREISRTGKADVLGKTLEWSAVRKDGSEVSVELTIAAMRLGSGWHSVVNMRDITERKRIDTMIRSMARHDSLTGLINRAAFVEALEQADARRRRGEANFALLYLDLDHFKDVNDTLGHPVGDLLLQQVAQRLKMAIRQTDTVARFGGDEFAIVAAEIAEDTDAAVLAGKILKVISEPFSVQGNEIRVGTSIGIAIYGSDIVDAETLLTRADVALYRAKAEGRGTYRFFTDAMDTDVRKRVAFSADLRDGIALGQLFLVYQPQVNVETGRIIGLEALVRWRHPDRGLVMPGEFIPVAEKTGLIVPIGQWVLAEACRQTKEWLDAGLGVPLIAVNVSALQFRTPFELESDVARVLAESSLPAGLLELELTESVLMETSQEHSDVLHRLSEAGVRMAIDDFGTGYSSLDYLAKFPIDRIKIAQTFMVGLEGNTKNAAIVRAAIGLAYELGFDVIVEGVETVSQLEAIRSWGARQVQGYYYSKPMLADGVVELLRAGTIVPVLGIGSLSPVHLQP